MKAIFWAFVFILLPDSLILKISFIVGNSRANSGVSLPIRAPSRNSLSEVKNWRGFVYRDQSIFCTYLKSESDTSVISGPNFVAKRFKSSWFVRTAPGVYYI